MDRTVKEILDTYNRGSTDQKHYILSASLTGDLRKPAMQDLTKRFQKTQRHDPKAVPNGLRDMKLLDRNDVSNNTKQALHTIRQSSEGLGSTLSVDKLIATHFAGHTTPGLLTNTLVGGSLKLVHHHLQAQHQNEMKMQKTADDKKKQRQPQRATEPAHSRSMVSDTKGQNPENDMNQMNVRRKSEEHNQRESDLARKKKLKRMRAAQAQKAKQQHMHF